MELVIGCVGKPSAGKSTFFNAVTDGKAKMGNFPFTTIDPNTGITHWMTECACKSRCKMSECSPKYGRCDDGTRHVPVKLLDVAGLIPGASKGAGLGNKFLDDLRHADVLLHIVDVSGTTNEKGEVCEGYDPINDAEWLDDEIHAWIFNNLWPRWDAICRRHTAVKATAQDTLSAQFSGYGATPAVVGRALDRMGVREPSEMASWSESRVHDLVSAFCAVRFPTTLVLNKADTQGDGATDRNIARLVQRYGEQRELVLASAAAELFLKKWRKQGLISYRPGGDDFISRQDQLADGYVMAPGETALKEADTPTRRRMARLKDMVLYRFGSTGVWDAVQRAVSTKQPLLLFPVRSITTYSTRPQGGAVFANCILVRPGRTIRSVGAALGDGAGMRFHYAEGEDGQRVADDVPLTQPINVLRFVLRASEVSASSGHQQQPDP